MTHAMRFRFLLFFFGTLLFATSCQKSLSKLEIAKVYLLRDIAENTDYKQYVADSLVEHLGVIDEAPYKHEKGALSDIKILHLFEDSGYVVAQMLYQEQVGDLLHSFVILRFEGNKIVESWENLAREQEFEQDGAAWRLPAKPASTDPERTIANKRSAEQTFISEYAPRDKDADEANEEYEEDESEFGEKSLTIEIVLGQGDLVLVVASTHQRNMMGVLLGSFYVLYHFKDDSTVEQWIVNEQIYLWEEAASIDKFGFKKAISTPQIK